MEIYQVGGSIRDELLGLPVRERDWVVVGATPEEMRALGYRAVGRDFPVFLHPETGEEYALARTERKTAPGYRGFEVHSAPDVTLEQDLARRDLTINAIARAEDGTLIDPYGGRRDVEARVLRHVSDAFVEDPVRILRVARFAARFAPLGFDVAPETMALMRRMVESGECAALVAERVWQETEKALCTESPATYFRVLRACGALAVVFPEIERLFEVPQPPQWHPEIDTGVHTLMVLDQATHLTADPRVRFAALVHDLGKGTTPKEEWPRHAGHEARSVELIDRLAERLRLPRDYLELARIVARHHALCHRFAELRDGTVLDLLEAVDAFRRPARLEQFVLACEADARGRTGFEERPYPQADTLRRCARAAAAVKVQPDEQALDGTQIQARLRQRRVAAIAAVRRPADPAPAGAGA
jgi:tRNA nucleotidyltransferase (CCA-adding enzyme)